MGEYDHSCHNVEDEEGVDELVSGWGGLGIGLVQGGERVAAIDRESE